MTNLLIAYPHIPAAALTVTTYTTAPGTGTPDDLYIAPVQNLWSRKRATEWWGAFSALSHNIEFDLGVGGNLSSDFLAFARIDRMTTTHVNYYLEGKLLSGDSWTTVNSWTAAGGLQSLPRYGTRLRDDYMTTFTASTAYRYWRMRFANADGNNFSARLSKLYFGQILDLGVEPNNFQLTPDFDIEGRLTTTSGSSRLVRGTQPKYKFDVTWEAVTDAKLQAFEQKIVLQAKRQSFFLYTASFHDVLRSFRQLHVNLTRYQTQSKKLNRNTITASFEEVLG